MDERLLSAMLISNMERLPDCSTFPAEDKIWTILLGQPILQMCRQTEMFAHRDAAFDGDHLGVVDDPAHNGIADRAVLHRIGIDPFIPPVCIVLCTEDGGVELGACLNDLKQIIRLLQR